MGAPYTRRHLALHIALALLGCLFWWHVIDWAVSL